MSGPGATLQQALYDLLRADAGVAAIVGARVYDNVPESPVFPYITIGPGYGVPEDFDEIVAGTEWIQVDGWTREQGRLSGARELADAIKKAVHGAELSLSLHAEAGVRVVLKRVMRDPDGKTGHAVVQVEVLTEEDDGD